MGLKMIFLSIESIEAISLAVSITVIVLLFITLTSLFYIYYRYYRRCIDHRLEDEFIKAEIKEEHKKYFKDIEILIVDASKTKQQKYDEFVLVEDEAEKARKKRNFIQGIFNIILAFFALIVIAIAAFSLYVRASGETFALGDVTYVIIQTGSMEEKNESNTYLEEHNLNNQIEALSLIGIEKVYTVDDIELYDIVAYYNDDKQLIVHRVINIDEDGTYTLRGDSNEVSSTEEKNLTFDEIVGKYNGFQNFPIGIALNYLRSNIGIITLTLAILLILIYDLFDMLLTKRIDRRKDDIYPVIDVENLERIDSLHRKPLIELVSHLHKHIDENTESIVEETVVQETAPSLTESVEIPVDEIVENEENDEGETFGSLTFLERLDLYPELKAKYLIIREYLLRHKLHSRVARAGDTYRKHKIRYVVIVLRGKSLVFHLKLKLLPAQLEALVAKDDSTKVKYQDVPTMFRVRSDLSMKRIKILLDMVLTENGFMEGDDIPMGDKNNEEEDSIIDEEIPSLEIVKEDES